MFKSALICLSFACLSVGVMAADMERSFWLHASLGLFTQKNYFGPDFPATKMPTEREVENAARLLTHNYGANRLYLIYHHELPIVEARQLFSWWRKACPAQVELVPTLVLKNYDKKPASVFYDFELKELVEFFQSKVNSERIGVYDIAPGRDQGPGLSQLAQAYAHGLLRVGMQPGEKLDMPFSGAVMDTWSGMCHGRRNAEDWQQPGFGAQTLKKWVVAQNAGKLPVAWDLVVVAWDYTATERGAYPGYDDATKNMPLPEGRTRLAADLIRKEAKPEILAGFSSDLYILHENSRADVHDGRKGSFYECLKRGEIYQGYYTVPFHEIVTLYGELRSAANVSSSAARQ